jgi:hypothetical protein
VRLVAASFLYPLTIPLPNWLELDGGAHGGASAGGAGAGGGGEGGEGGGAGSGEVGVYDIECVFENMREEPVRGRVQISGIKSCPLEDQVWS